VNFRKGFARAQAAIAELVDCDSRFSRLVDYKILREYTLLLRRASMERKRGEERVRGYKCECVLVIVLSRARPLRNHKILTCSPVMWRVRACVYRNSEIKSEVAVVLRAEGGQVREK